MHIVDVREDILREDRESAAALRTRLAGGGTFMINLMGSPGAGKTNLLVTSIKALRDRYRIAVIEGDVDSTIDAEEIEKTGSPAVQIRTGGFCHLDVHMVSSALEKLGSEAFDIIFVENIGNLICPAAHDIGAALSIVILSVPEGSDKPWKYPGIFRAADAVVISKIDYPDWTSFGIDTVKERLEFLHPGVKVFPLSAKTGDGAFAFTDWISEEISRLGGRQGI